MPRALTLIFACLLVAPSNSAHAAPSDADLGDIASFLALFPNARTLPAPAFLVPGVRVSYATGAASGGIDGVAGGGVLQYDVVARDLRQVTAYLHSYGDIGAGVFPLATGPALGYPGIGPFWINPSVLVGAERFANANLTISRYQKTIADGTTLAVIRFQTSTANGQTVTEFDTGTGVMVFTSVANSTTSAGQVVLLGLRTVASPWAADRAPNWAQTGAALTYTGAHSTTIAAAGTVQQPYAISAQITDAGARWSLLHVATQLNGQNQGAGPAVTGGGQLIGSFWLPVSALTAQLPATATVFDTDPFTGAQLLVQRDPQSGAILLQEATQAALTSLIYDPTLGVLVRFNQQVQQEVSFTEDDVSLTGGSDLAALAQQPPLADDPGANGATGGDGGCAGGPPPGLLAVFAAAGLTLIRRRRARA
ncbi:MAG: hypothetical protein CVU56_06625 [Deltaproteobacteria bacterium HGW-Deltaproteobacteria-14]|jgi:MYXO-CTERM domain-containing protein|nr:MAG: hypothetical protein CVU56_06625 [Deltaproteobacteria bacterium HGW-Deltaproteobacteria-14]